MLAWKVDERAIVLVSLIELCFTCGFKSKADDATATALLKFMAAFAFDNADNVAAITSLTGLLEAPSLSAKPLSVWQGVRTSLKASHRIVKHVAGLPWAIERIAKLDKFLLDSKKDHTFSTKLAGTQTKLSRGVFGPYFLVAVFG